MLRAFVEEIGHDFEPIMTGAMEEDAKGKEDTVDELSLAIANKQLQLNLRPKRQGDAESRDEDEWDTDSSSSKEED